MDLISSEQARRAIYFDFEGSIGRPPTLIGYAWADAGVVHFEQRIVEAHLLRARRASVAGTGILHRPRRGELCQVIEDLVGLAEHEDRLLVSWTRFDLEKIREAEMPEDVLAYVEQQHVDACAIAKAWRRLEEGRAFKRGENTLENYCRLVRFAIPSEFGPGVTGRAIRDVRRLCAEHRSWREMPCGVRERWVRMLGHNYCDVTGMRAVTLAACRA